MKLIESNKIPQLSDLFYDIGKIGRGKLSIAIGTSKETEQCVKKMKRRYGEPSIVYYNTHVKAKPVAFEWVLSKGAKELPKVKRLLKNK